MIEVIKNEAMGIFAGFPNDYLFDKIKTSPEFFDGYLKEQIDKYVTKESVCVDVGANFGYVSVYMAPKCKKLYSIEPQPVVYLQLCCNLFLNQRFNVTPLNLAVGEADGFMDFSDFQQFGFVGTNDFSDYSKIRSIASISLKQSENGKMPLKKLDSIIKERVDFIKIDAQGGDISVLFGSEDIIKNYRPIILFEYEEDLSVNNYKRNMNDLTPFIEKNCYNINSIFGTNYILTPK